MEIKLDETTTRRRMVCISLKFWFFLEFLGLIRVGFS